MPSPFDFQSPPELPSQQAAGRPTATRPASGGGRRAMGLPAGSIRAVLTFLILGLSWALMIMGKSIPSYLQYLMFLILGHYFAARHHSVAPADVRDPSPLYLPRGFIRALIFVGFLGVAGGLYFQHRDNAHQWLKTAWTSVQSASGDGASTYVPLVLVAGFFIGLISAMIGRMIGGRDGQPGWYQDIQAWVALLAMLGLGAEVIIRLIVNPSLEAQDKPPIAAWQLESILAAVIGFYFGARS